MGGSSSGLVLGKFSAFGEMQSKVQAVVFVSGPKRHWSPVSMIAWLDSHGFEPIKSAHKVGSTFRYRILEPSQFERFTTKTILHEGKKINLVLGWN